MPKITLYFLQASRCIRTAWLLEELGLDYEVKFMPRENGVAPQSFKKEAGGLGKFPTLVDGDLVLYESGNIAEYLCDVYDKEHRLLPPLGDPKRYAALQWVHAAEGTYALHSLPVLYVRWFQKTGDVEQTEAGMSINIQKDLDYFESELSKNNTKFIVGNSVSIADTMVQFSVGFVLARELGTKGKKWPKIEQYVKDCEATEAYQRAVKKTGHEL